MKYPSSPSSSSSRSSQQIRNTLRIGVLPPYATLIADGDNFLKSYQNQHNSQRAKGVMEPKTKGCAWGRAYLRRHTLLHTLEHVFIFIAFYQTITMFFIQSTKMQDSGAFKCVFEFLMK